MHAAGCPRVIWLLGCEASTSVKANLGAMKLRCGTRLIGGCLTLKLGSIFSAYINGILI